ncbi:hypothetical protein Goshw_025066 [Gossypium schwendimanii]|uniref:Uncharacterized protein n=1 Tax=Gossypium schwendimanii TaxID=34291 RepID=A0A7J9LR08_GOSSC|nr:hypothetical protein [Gossypium schwendimanii]
MATPRRDNISEEKWIVILQNLQDEDVKWKAPWMVSDEILIDQSSSYQQHKGWLSASFHIGLITKRKRFEKCLMPETKPPSQEGIRSMEEHLQVVPSELEIIKQDFEKRNSEKLEAEKLRKGKSKAEEDLDSLKMDYKKLRLLMRTTGLGKILNNIEELEKNIEELETALQNCELRVKLLEANNEHWKEQLHHSQEVADHLQTLAVQAKVLSLKYESKLDRGRELAWLLTKVKTMSIRARPYILPTKHRYGTRAKTKVMDQILERLEHIQKEMQDQLQMQLQMQLQEQLAKVQQDMRDQIQESQRSMKNQLTQLLAKGLEKGKSTTQPEAYPRRVPVTIKPQQFQACTSMPMNYQTGSGSNSGDNPTNPIVFYLDDMAEMEKNESGTAKVAGRPIQIVKRKFQSNEKC